MMITKEKLEINLNRLREIIPIRPKVYTKDHPISIGEALHKYSNRRSVNGFEICVMNLDKNNWPLPLWFDPNNIKVGILNKLFYRRQFSSWKTPFTKNKKFKGFKDFDYLWVPVLNEFFFKKDTDTTLAEAFNVNKKFVERKLKSNVLLQSKSATIEEIFKTYRKGFWISCINTIFPLLDYITRRLLKTTNLSVDVMKICKLFEQNGFSDETVDYLMPHVTFVKVMEQVESTGSGNRRLGFIDVINEVKTKTNGYNLSIIGPALSSFLRFANQYYGYYKDDQGDACIINRHAILHGAISLSANKISAIKLITFMYLFLELEPVFKVLLDEEY
jgi:hypothetical protein